MEEQSSPGMDRLKALLAWWGMSRDEDQVGLSRQFDQFYTFVSEVQKAYLDATSRHLEAISATNDRLARSSHGLLRSQTQTYFVASQAEIVAAVVEQAARHADAWAAFQKKVQDVYAGIFVARDDKQVEKRPVSPKASTDNRSSGQKSHGLAAA